MTNQIKRAYIRHYADNGQTTAYVEWADGSRTEGKPCGTHMVALLARAKREGLTIERETWDYTARDKLREIGSNQGWRAQ